MNFSVVVTRGPIADIHIVTGGIDTTYYLGEFKLACPRRVPHGVDTFQDFVTNIIDDTPSTYAWMYSDTGMSQMKYVDGKLFIEVTSEFNGFSVSIDTTVHGVKGTVVASFIYLIKNYSRGEETKEEKEDKKKYIEEMIKTGFPTRDTYYKDMDGKLIKSELPDGIGKDTIEAYRELAVPIADRCRLELYEQESEEIQKHLDYYGDRLPYDDRIVFEYVRDLMRERCVQ